jgi:hypothetical protein
MLSRRLLFPPSISRRIQSQPRVLFLADARYSPGLVNYLQTRATLTKVVVLCVLRAMPAIHITQQLEMAREVGLDQKKTNNSQTLWHSIGLMCSQNVPSAAARRKRKRDLCEDTSSLFVPRTALAPAKAAVSGGDKRRRACRPLHSRFLRERISPLAEAMYLLWSKLSGACSHVRQVTP